MRLRKDAACTEDENMEFAKFNRSCIQGQGTWSWERVPFAAGVDRPVAERAAIGSWILRCCRSRCLMQWWGLRHSKRPRGKSTAPLQPLQPRQQPGSYVARAGRSGSWELGWRMDHQPSDTRELVAFDFLEPTRQPNSSRHDRSVHIMFPSDLAL
jgi:hypothetical protein